jgi:hypothetical protein
LGDVFDDARSRALKRVQRGGDAGIAAAVSVAILWVAGEVQDCIRLLRYVCDADVDERRDGAELA